MQIITTSTTTNMLKAQNLGLHKTRLVSVQYRLNQ